MEVYDDNDEDYGGDPVVATLSEIADFYDENCLCLLVDEYEPREIPHKKLRALVAQAKLIHKKIDKILDGLSESGLLEDE